MFERKKYESFENNHLMLRLWMEYARLGTKAQFLRLLGAPGAYSMVNRWELPALHPIARRPDTTNLKRMARLMMWQLEGRCRINLIDAVDWENSTVEWTQEALARDERENPLKSPFDYYVGSDLKDGVRVPVYHQSSYSGADDNTFRAVARRMPASLGLAGLGRLLGLDASTTVSVYRWRSGENHLGPRYTVRAMLVTLWMEYGIIEPGNIWRIRWEARQVEWRNGVPLGLRVDPFSVGNWIKPVRDYRATLPPQPTRKPPERRRSLRPTARTATKSLKQWTTPTELSRLEIITTQDDAGRRRARYL